MEDKLKRMATIGRALLLMGFSICQTTNLYSSQINTADRNGAYHQKFCPPLQAALKNAQFDYKCEISAGSRENINRVQRSATQIGFSQLDVFAIEKTMLGGKKYFHTLRNDIASECLFMISKNPDLKSYGDIVSKADQLKFILPPEKSGHVGTFQYLQHIDPEGLGLVKNILYAQSTDEAINKVLDANDKDRVTLFVQFPDANNSRFKSIAKKNGIFIPVIDRKILRQDINGEKVYYAHNTQINNPGFTKKAVQVITACTPMVLFTGVPDRIEDQELRKDQLDLIRTIEALPITQLQPQQNFLLSLWNKTKSISAQSLESLLKASDKARETAKPVLKKAQEVGSKALEASKPLIEKAKEVGDQTLKKAEELAQRAKDTATELLEKKDTAQ